MERFRLFATPIAVFDVEGVEELNLELAERLLQEEQYAPGAGPGWTRSNVGGWHSAPDLSLRPEPCYRALMGMVVEHVSALVDTLAREAGAEMAPRFRYGVQGWAMIMRRGHYIILHEHGDAHFSAVYYVDAGDADLTAHPGSGLIAFVDPRRGGRPIEGLDLFSTTFTIRPRTSALVIFPGYVQHYVHPYKGTRPRISISCNLLMERAAPRPGP